MRAFPISRRNSPRSASPVLPSHDSAGLRRYGALAAAAAVVCTVGVAFAPAAGAAADLPRRPESSSARASLLESIAARPNSTAIPDDFAAAAGYRPVVEAGMLLNPEGDCSSPVPLPAEFDLACKSHDLGYDLLRYAAAHGQPLGPWARRSVDAALEQRMHTACAAREDALSRTRCQVMATIAATAVDLNSIRQNYGSPVYEPFFEHTGTGPTPAALVAAGAGIAGLAFAATIPVRRTRSRRGTAARERDVAIAGPASAVAL
ncbi:hypothetical protein ABZ412_11615 [Nocardia sp. NPDC005746]|uniref:hypothetical protein n=1 Tax=Nocardia sp. NPDC005746 TaxID=3157062 RepID=UPI0033EAFDA0